MLDTTQIEQVIQDYVDPSTAIALGQTKPAIEVKQEGTSQHITVTLGYHVKGYASQLESELEAALVKAGAESVNVTIISK
ncbi:hypothetical protein LCGC14_0772600, partial [marine sediment metagenome]